MLKIFNKNNPQNRKTPSQPTAAAAHRMEDLVEIFSSFPIGTRISYYPEFKEDIKLESIIIAYAVNGDMFYSDTDIQWQNGNTILQLVSEGQRKRYDAVESLQLIIPASGGAEEKLDYARKESLGRNSGFITGNNITIMAQQQGGRVPLIQTTVTRRLKIRNGYYANQDVVLLNVDSRSLDMVDQRKNSRLETTLPATLLLNRGNNEVNCTLLDFSEQSAKIAFDADAPYTQHIAPDQVIVLRIQLQEGHKIITLRGQVFRRGENTAVVNLREIERDGGFSPMSLIDSLELKTLVLQHSSVS